MTPTMSRAQVNSNASTAIDDTADAMSYRELQLLEELSSARQELAMLKRASSVVDEPLHKLPPPSTLPTQRRAFHAQQHQENMEMFSNRHQSQYQSHHDIQGSSLHRPHGRYDTLSKAKKNFQHIVMYTATNRCSKLPPRSTRQRFAGTNKGPLKTRHLKDHTHQHKSGFCEYCWGMETPATPTLLDETSAGLSDNPFTGDDEDEAFSDSSSVSSCLEEDKSSSQKNIKDEIERKLEVMTMPRMTSSSMGCEIVTHRRVIRRRISRPSPLPSLYRASVNSQEATSGSGFMLILTGLISDSGFSYGAPKRAMSSANVTSSQSWNYRNGMTSGPQSPAPGYSSMRSMGGSLRSGSAYLGSQGYSARRERLKQEAEQAEALRQSTQRINHVAASSNDLRSTSLHQQRRQHYHSMSTIQASSEGIMGEPERTEFEEIETVTLQPIGRGVQDLGSNMGSTATLNRGSRRPVASSMLEGHDTKLPIFILQICKLLGLNRVDTYGGNRQSRANMSSFGRQTSAMDISQTTSARPQRAASNSFLSSLRRQSTGTVSDAGSFRPVAISTNKPNTFATQQQKQQQQVRHQFQQSTSTSRYSSTMQQHQSNIQQQQQQIPPVPLQSSSQQLKSQQMQQQQQIQQNQRTKQEMEWSNNNNHHQNTTNGTSVNIAAPVPVNGQVDLSLVEATSPVWYRLKISRQEAISILKNQPTGSFLVRDSTTFKDAYGLAVKSSKPPNKPGQKSGFAKFMKNILKFTAVFSHIDDINNDLVRHYLIETVTTPTRGVRIKGFSAEQVFPNLLALIQYHTQYPVALPCCLVLPPIPPSQTSAAITNTASNSSLRNGNGNTNGDSDSITLVQNNGIRSLNQTPTSFNGNAAATTATMPAIATKGGESLDAPTSSRSITSPLSPTVGMFHSELISPPPNISCRCLYLGAVEVDINQSEQASLMAAVDTLIPCPVLQAATCDQLGADSPVQYTECQLQAAHSEGILLTDLSRKLFFQRHFSANSFIYAGIDHRDKAFIHPNHSALGIDKPKLFGFIIKKLSGENMAHIFSEFDANCGASMVTAQINSLLLNK
ncbi:unnamed protein product [Hymenolepis diminuta]|uniref:SH2 domain-containing protein n=1 Tax=Hymenolepis diminuta TaxID=6216 RepID=A0A3P7ARY2_HYMDI|nr:unnamed protein product [Hymenolepis diminuta]